MTRSAQGQQAPLAEREKWDSDFAKRKKINSISDTVIPEFPFRIVAATSIDITKPDIDNAYWHQNDARHSKRHRSSGRVLERQTGISNL